MTSRRRKPTVVELDAKLIRDYIVESSGPESGEEFWAQHSLLAALSRLERRATGTSVSGVTYVLHIDRDGFSNSTWCGRVREAVNYVTQELAARNISSDEYCQSCAKAYLRAHPEKAPTDAR